MYSQDFKISYWYPHIFKFSRCICVLDKFGDLAAICCGDGDVHVRDAAIYGHLKTKDLLLGIYLPADVLLPIFGNGNAGLRIEITVVVDGFM